MVDKNKEHEIFDLKKLENFVKETREEKYAKVEKSSMEYVRLSINGEYVQEEQNLYYSFDC